MFIPIMLVEKVPDGGNNFNRRKAVVPGACIKIVEEIQNDDADENGMFYENGARSLIELTDGELLYVADNIEYFVQ